jgi:hypothetical protein
MGTGHDKPYTNPMTVVWYIWFALVIIWSLCVVAIIIRNLARIVALIRRLAILLRSRLSAG